jgi:uncharacterized protein (DUF433 family)
VRPIFRRPTGALTFVWSKRRKMRYNTSMIKSTQAPVATESPIRKTPNVCGGSACIRNTRIPVWSLVAWRDQGVNDQRLLEMFPTLSADDLRAAWTYYISNRDEIDQDIKSNEDG